MNRSLSVPLINIVIPVYNEEKNIEALMLELDKVRTALQQQYCFEIIFVNDGSVDMTYDTLVSLARNKKYVKVLDLSRNFGAQIAVSAGIYEAQGDAVITMDGDLQHPPSIIPELLKEWEKGSEIVQTRRVAYHDPRILKRVLSSAFFYLMNHITEVKIEKELSDFRLLDRKAVAYFNRIKETKRFVRGIVNWLGFRKSYVEYQVQPRLEGSSGFSLWQLVKLAIINLTSFSYLPLKIASVLGGGIIIFSTILLIFMTYTYLFGNKMNFRPIAFFTVLNALMGGLILICLGFIAMYIGNIAEEVKQRPMYVVRERINFDKTA